jgi:mono/diheme cytochrome c family protein
VRLLVIVLAVALSAAAPAAQESKSGGNPEAAKLKNPVAPSPESIAAGQQIYGKRCRACHGGDGAGGFAGASNLVDAEWNHGSTDGEIHRVIMLGIGPSFRMEAFEDRLSDTDGWNVVNFLRSIAKK